MSVAAGFAAAGRPCPGERAWDVAACGNERPHRNFSEPFGSKVERAMSGRAEQAGQFIKIGTQQAMSSVVVPPSLTILSSPPPPPTPMGLIAGGGRLPIVIAQSLRDAGHPVHGLGLANQYEPELPSLCSTFRSVGLLRIGSWGKILSGLGVRHAIMVGKVDKAKLMHDPWRMLRNLPDWAAIVSWYRHLRHDKRSHAVLSAVADQLIKSGVTLLDSTAPIPEELATIGPMTAKAPTAQQQADIDFAWPLLAHSLRLDIGQAIAVRERDVIAVEAVEGTDRMIERAGKLCRKKGWTLVKGARVGHDRRADVPTVGVNTVRNLHSNGGTCLALAAGDVIMLDKEHMIRLANRLGIAIVGVERLHGITDGSIAAEAINAQSIRSEPFATEGSATGSASA